MKSVLLALTIVTGFAGAALAEEQYLFDTIKQPAYAAAWKAMLKGEKNLPSWVAKFAGTQAATSAPNKTVEVNGDNDLLGWICKPHDCGGNEVFVLFTPDAGQAFAMLIVADGTPRWLGHPDTTLKAALQHARVTN